MELDALRWSSNWKPVPMTELIPKAERFTDVILMWPPYATSLVRLLLRTAVRILRRDTLWAGNRETLRMTLSRGSNVLWYLKTFRRRGCEYLALHRKPEYRHLRFHLIKSHRDVEFLLAALPGDRMGLT